MGLAQHWGKPTCPWGRLRPVQGRLWAGLSKLQSRHFHSSRQRTPGVKERMRQGDGHLAGYKDPLFTGDSKVSARRTSRPLSPTHLLHLPHWGMGRYGRQASVGRCASSDGHRATLPSHNSSLSPSSCHPASEPMSLEEGGEKKGRQHTPGLC